MTARETKQKWNPYWLAYAVTHGQTPDAMLMADREDWPGGQMRGFMIWIARRWSEWAALRGLRRTASGRGDDLLTENHRADFGGWLRGRAFAIAEQLDGPRSSFEPLGPEYQEITPCKARRVSTGG